MSFCFAYLSQSGADNRYWLCCQEHARAFPRRQAGSSDDEGSRPGEPGPLVAAAPGRLRLRIGSCVRQPPIGRTGAVRAPGRHLALFHRREIATLNVSAPTLGRSHAIGVLRCFSLRSEQGRRRKHGQRNPGFPHVIPSEFSMADGLPERPKCSRTNSRD
jgi:hypothetical protein